MTTTTETAPWTVERTDDGAPIMGNTVPWLIRRRTGIGASDAPAILGLSPWSSPRDVYLSKVSDTIADEQTEAMEMGHRLEPVILSIVRDRHGNPDNQRHRYLGKIEPSPGMLRSREHPHLLASLDGVVVEHDGTLAPINAKNVSVYRRKSWEDTEYGAPDEVAIQVFQEAIVLGADHGYAAPFYGNTMPEPIRLDVPRDFREWYLAESKLWWDGHVVAGVEPAPTMLDDLADIWTGVMGEGVALDDEALAAAARHKELGPIIKALEEERAECALKVKIAMGDATEGYDMADPFKPRLAATWRPYKEPKAVFHRDELLADHPELADLLAAYTRRDGATPRPFLSK